MTTVATRAGGIDGAVARPGPAFTDLAVVLCAALALRLIAYHGIFGSDDGVYLDRARDIANGEWTAANYNGALRYAFNIPVGALIWAFGDSPLVANLWPLACSLAEVALVYAMAAAIGGRSAGLMAGVLLATAPLHVGVATRIHADPIVAAMLTLSFVLVWFGWRENSRRLLFAAGLAIGAVFWAKELVAITWLALLPMLWLFRGRWTDVLFAVAGVAIMLLLHGVLMYAVAGDPLHLIRTVLGQVQTSFIESGQGEDAASYYLRYLYFDVRHVGVLGWLATAALAVLAWQRFVRGTATLDGAGFVVVWLVGLLLVLSVLPVSLSPLRFVMKQSNYISLFLGPLAILSAVLLAGIAPRVSVIFTVVGAAVGVLLALLQQADYRAFTANSKALAEWSLDNPNAIVIGSKNSEVAGEMWARAVAPGRPHAALLSFATVNEKPAVLGDLNADASGGLYAYLDPRTQSWGAGSRLVLQPLPCWVSIRELPPVDLALGNRLAALLRELTDSMASLGVPAAGTASNVFGELSAPESARLYRVQGSDPLCRAR